MQPAAFGELLEVGVAAGAAAKARLAAPAERGRCLVLRSGVVDVDQARPQLPGDFPAAEQVAGDDRVDQPVAGVVGQRDRLVGVLDHHDRRDRGEDLLRPEGGAGGHASDDRRLERTGARWSRPP